MGACHVRYFQLNSSCSVTRRCVCADGSCCRQAAGGGPGLHRSNFSPRTRKTQRPFATWAIAKGRTLMRLGCLPSPLLLLPGSCGRFTDIRCTIVLFARTGQAKSRHRTVISRSHEPPSAARIRSIICIISSVSGQRGSMASARGKGKRRWSRGLRGNARPAGLGPVRLTSPSSSTGWGGLGRRHDRQCYLPQLLEPSKGH
jgi:hypothetical protein